MYLQQILDNGILQVLQTCITERVKGRREACFVVSNIAMATPREAKVPVKSSILALLIETVADQEEEAEVQREALTALQHLAEKGEKKGVFLTSLVDADCVEACCATLRSQDGLRVDHAVRIIAYLIDTPWSGADDAIQRLEDSDGVKSLRRVWLQGWRRGGWNGSRMAHILLKAYFPEASKPARLEPTQITQPEQLSID
ncbi:hypothetical protein FRC00_002589 [Tulasnella sp. 408]|nr:hypothetical protein FRC00_002589 [Tulasnella sp. 408]